MPDFTNKTIEEQLIYDAMSRMDFKAMAEAYQRLDTEWHEQEWKEFISAVITADRQRIFEAIEKEKHHENEEGYCTKNGGYCHYCGSGHREIYNDGLTKAQQIVKGEK